MKQILTLVVALFCATPALAENFSSYEAYQSILDKKMKNREFANVVREMGGADEYSEQELARIQIQLREVAPYYLTNADIVKRVELENGYSQELRAYWNDKNSYIFLYALLHQRDDGLVPIQFYINTSPEELLKKF
ncbi:hypothetical protein [Ruegeria atlantica]|uniref:hypothetical protein n=1 Tax=Ruegeria atlantica TaxID=81569 RepID=UPI00147ACA15|nr:hypothetical protein [Ruegeria atlantica]